MYYDRWLNILSASGASLSCSWVHASQRSISERTSTFDSHAADMSTIKTKKLGTPHTLWTVFTPFGQPLHNLGGCYIHPLDSLYTLWMVLHILDTLYTFGQSYTFGISFTHLGSLTHFGRSSCFGQSSHALDRFTHFGQSSHFLESLHIWTLFIHILDSLLSSELLFFLSRSVSLMSPAARNPWCYGSISAATYVTIHRQGSRYLHPKICTR